MSCTRLNGCLSLLIALFSLIAPAARALQPDEVALIVNSNEPAGRELAQHYADARHIPENRILELDLPGGEEMSFKQYEEQVVPQVREYLRTGRLETQVKCFVTFYGVPIRIGARVPAAADGQEQANLRRTLLQVSTRILAPVQAVEKFATEMDPAFRPGAGTDFDHLAERAAQAQRAVNAKLAAIADATQRAEATSRWFATVEPLVGGVARVRNLSLEAVLHPASQPTTQRQALESLALEFQRAAETAARLQERRFDPKAREELRTLVLKSFGLFKWVKLLRDQTDYLETKDTTAAFDSELALVRWATYPRVRWADNPLFYSIATRPLAAATLMVSRLDAPKPELVRQIIDESIRVEAEGLKGKAVFDSRGMSATQPKPAERGLVGYDEAIRVTANLVRDHTSLQLVLDDKPEVLPPNSVDGVALYCGWYSVHQYVPACKFNPGAIGFHLASYEMRTLHDAADSGWVVGLLRDGVAATVGPVDEPYLQTFPRPDDFFPLLLSGKLTLAEVYWRTTPAASWMVSLIGDPLYTPYKNNPPLAVGDLPERLKVLFPATSKP